MLELLGKSYIIDHCYNYLKELSEETALKVYMTDAIKAVVENTGRVLKEGGVVMRKRYIELIMDVPNEEQEEDNDKRAKGIIARMKTTLDKLGKEDAENG